MHTEGGKLLLRQVTARYKGKRAQLQSYAGNCQQKIERKELGLQPAEDLDESSWRQHGST